MPLTRTRLLTLLGEVLIALGMVAGVILYAQLGPFNWMPSARWWGLAAISALVFWTAARRYRAYWRRMSFWFALASLLALHLAAWTLVLAWASRWGLFWFAPAGVLEAAALVWMLDEVGFHAAGRHHD